ncbi:NAD(P)-binding domain-containing protein [Spongiactinospora sp. TRM90649]|uniref:NADPH-dependent F420 reductase n=1 Tax=Spongiactinospora sp. TRM90649 TaxID=3031114 RepID=UPI0023F622C7|nr:NAD(P)-binding domain-containing protein [Spongiactinospora sp. TRM90649]MDF5752906.1 NAD(P)-binding domain-containing protein [Spongiactinospora sp. TRM90649]
MVIGIIGIIGSGHIGSTLARLAVNAGHTVVLSNSRGPETLSALVAGMGPAASAATAEQAAAHGDVVVVSIPFSAHEDVPSGPLKGKVVIDTGNYYAQRDGNIPAIDDGRTTNSELLAAHLGDARVVKAFNVIPYAELANEGLPPGHPERRALPIAGDDADAKKTVTELIDSFGFDVVDAGPLAEGRRFQPGTPSYVTRLTAAELREALASA